MGDARPTIGARLRQAREAKRLTQEQLSERAGVAFGTLVRWERDRQAPRGPDISALCDALDVSSDWLLGRTDMPRQIVPGYYLIDVVFVEALLSTTDPDKIDELCSMRPGPVVDFGTVLTEGVEFISPERARAIERRVVNHIAQHARGELRKIFRRHN